MKTVIIADQLHSSASSLIQNAGFKLIDVSSKKEDFLTVINQADAIIVRSATKITRDILSQAPKLKIIGRAGVGLDNIDLDACNEKNIAVVNSPDGPTRSVAELTLGLIISVSRKLGLILTETKAGNWPKKRKGFELYNKTIGIIGSGAIGGTLAKYCIALGMKVIAYDILTFPELEKLENFTYVSLNALLSSSDVISLHVPLLTATKHILNKANFEKMKKGVIIVNTARGGLIDERALISALDSGIVTGVGLDVYENEPVDPHNPLLTHSSVFTTSHIGAQTFEAEVNNAKIVSEKIIEFLK